MEIKIYEFVMASLKSSRIPWTQVSKETGVPYDTLKKIGSEVTKNPGVRQIEILAEYFKKNKEQIN